MHYKHLIVSAILAFSPLALAAETALDSALNSDIRSQSAQRDQYRHPRQTLNFFDVKPSMTVVEIWPGAGGWYTEILAPYLNKSGKLYAAHFNADSSAAYYRNSLQSFIEKFDGKSKQFGALEVTTFNPPQYMDIAPANSADRVLTFRSIHNWYMRGGGDQRVEAAFNAMYRALKPGGILGVVEHRLPPTRPLSDQERSGYMREDYVIARAKAAGFTLLASSDINANPRDSANHPKGVWTLPPSLRLGDENRAHYLAIGESDRMTLKFVKPKSVK